MKVDVSNISNRGKINKMIHTLQNCNFIIRMFKSVENENYYYLTFEMTEENLERYAQE